MSGYEDVLSRMPSEVSIGCGGVNICSLTDLPAMQRGYAIGPAGEPLWGDGDGDWRKEWIVIGQESTCGDPIFIDTEAAGYPVYTAIHGQGRWDPDPVATSLEGFREALEATAPVSMGREYRIDLSENPITPAERDDVLRAVRQFNPGIDLSFWRLMLDDDLSEASEI